MYLPDTSATAGTLQLAQALDAAIPGATSSGSWELARTLQVITGGVPLYLEHAMHAMLADADFLATLVQEERRAHLSSCVEALVRKKGGAYLAVRLAAEEHFTRHIAATAIAERSETERREAAAHLLDLALLKGRPLKLSEDDADHLDSALSDFMTAGGVVTLLEAAHVCGVHRQFDKEKGTVTFLMPPPVREGLRSFSRCCGS
jgi:truncated hemoglobin YjbI